MNIGRGWPDNVLYFKVERMSEYNVNILQKKNTVITSELNK